MRDRNSIVLTALRTMAILLCASSILGWAQSPLSTVLYSSGTTAQYYLTTNSHIEEIYNNPDGTFGYQDNTALTGAPLAGAGSPLATLLYSSGTTAQYYVSSASHVQEIWNNPDGTFGYQDNTALAGAPAAAASSPLSIVLYSTGTTAQYFLTSSGHVVEIINNPNGTVSYQDNTSLTGAPVAAVGSPLATVLYSSGTTAQYYLSSDGHVQEIWNNPDGTFGHQDNTALAGSPTARSSSPLRIVLYSTGTTAQYFLTSSGHVVEIINNPNGTVSYQDNTALTGAPVAR